MHEAAADIANREKNTEEEEEEGEEEGEIEQIKMKGEEGEEGS